MGRYLRLASWASLTIGLWSAIGQAAPGQVLPPLFLPEQRSIDVRDPASLPHARIPDLPPPATVTRTAVPTTDFYLSLDEAIRIALNRAQAVRVLSGVVASASGRTIYDPAIRNTGIDREQARFDPRLQAQQSFNRSETPQGVLDPLNPGRSVITGLRTDDYQFNGGLGKTNFSGGELGLNLFTNPARSQPGIFPLNPQTRSSAELSYTQPLLQGAGRAVNQVPIVLARIETERSFFQFKDSLQELVRGVIEAYWAVVFARTDVWAREQQVEQATEAYERADAQARFGLADAATVSQTRLALNNFRATLLNSRANLLQREAALRNILGLPPQDELRLVPVSPPCFELVQPDWRRLLELAEEHRPDVVELKLVLEADQQLLLQARNLVSPRLDAVALYRWNGLEGEMPLGDRISTGAGQFADWTLGVNFSVPLSLRQERANLRQVELLISRDRVNLDQQLHAAAHLLAVNYRNLAQYYEQYKIFEEAREAAFLNLQQQWAEYRSRRAIFLNVLLAISDWGNAISSEAQAVVQYNIELANLERQTGTILETHGIWFYEERHGSIGPLGRHACAEYPAALPPTSNNDRYPHRNEPAERVFDLTDPLQDLGGEEVLPPPAARP